MHDVSPFNKKRVTWLLKQFPSFNNTFRVSDADGGSGRSESETSSGGSG